MSTIRYWNRAAQREETEKVYGDSAIHFLYENSFGFFLSDKILSRAWVSKLYGAWQSSSLSQGKVAPFIQNFAIPMDEFEKGPFASFNDFFIRKFLPGKRIFAAEKTQLPAFAEARYFGFAKTTESVTSTVKGIELSPLALLGNTPGKETFLNGPSFIARLCPVDYHRFHFPDNGHISHFHEEKGKLHSVNPLALAKKTDIFLSNERAITILDTENFGKIAYIEVGALCVGKIVQSHEGQSFVRGAEKGYFLFGGSTVIVLGEPGKWLPHQDILERTAKGEECLVRLGEAIAKSTKAE